jgi:hypothetical protein
VTCAGSNGPTGRFVLFGLEKGVWGRNLLKVSLPRQAPVRKMVMNYAFLPHRAAAALRAISGRCTGSIDGAATYNGLGEGLVKPGQLGRNLPRVSPRHPLFQGARSHLGRSPGHCRRTPICSPPPACRIGRYLHHAGLVARRISHRVLLVFTRLVLPFLDNAQLAATFRTIDIASSVR